MDIHSKNWFIITFSSMLEDYTDEDLDLVWAGLSSYQLDFIQDVGNAYYNAGYQAAVEDAM
jgi:uncharacterized protein (DUF2164 family)